LLYDDFKNSIKALGFENSEDFAKYIGVAPIKVLTWEDKGKIPYSISLIIRLLQGDKSVLPVESSVDKLIEECLPLASLLEESSSFPHKLEEMFLMQKKLNDDTNGKNWELGVNAFNKEISWLRCIHMEVSELIDSTPWKHWKNINSKPDMDNVHIELVDIWHFLMSYILQETNIPKAVSLVNTHCIYEPLEELDVLILIEEVEKLSYLCFAVQTGNMPLFSAMERLIDQFFRSCKVSGLSFTWLQKLYIGKNCLNKFRQEHGYKEGTYIKKWNGKEDNVIMMAFLNDFESITFAELYEKLEDTYFKLRK